MSLHIFNSLDSFWKYVEQTSGYSRTTQFSEWSKAVQEIQNSAKYSETFDQFGRYSGVFDDSIKENYVGVGNTVNTSAGVKSAPTIESVYTQSGSSSSVKTAVKTEPSVGMQTRGPIGMTPIMNVVSGVAAALGLVHLGITTSNWRSWRDCFNYVFNANLSDDATFDDVVAFGKSRIQLYFTGVDDYTATYVPEHIVNKLYNYFSNHTIVTGDDVEEVYDTLMFGYNTFSRLTPISSYYDVVPRTTPPTEPLLFGVKYTAFSDSLLKNQMNDFLSQLIGGGVPVADSVSEFLINNMNGVYNAIDQTSQQSHDTLLNSNVVNVRFRFTRNAPKSQPLSANEVSVYIVIAHDTSLQLSSDNTTNQLEFGTNYVPQACCKGLKPGRTGGETAYSDYAYYIKPTYDTATMETPILQVSVTFPSSERNIVVYSEFAGYMFGERGMGGFSIDFDNIQGASTLSGSYDSFYSNFSYDGSSRNYSPDEYLLRAGWQKSKTDAKLPRNDKTLEEGYTEWFHKRQQVAQPDKNSENTDSFYMPVTVPNGMSNADSITSNGYNPQGQDQSYIQSGRMPDNTNIDDVNDDIGEAVKQYNDTDITIESAPEPIPETDVNPQYPTTPPTEPSGDSGDTPTVPEIGGLTASGMVSVYNPTKQEIIDFSGWLWSSDFFDNFIRLFANPMDAIIGLHILYATPITGNRENIIVGYLDSEVSSKVVTQQYFKVDCGTISIPEYYGNATDYEPYTTIHIYLPFIGIVPLKTNDVLGKQLHLEYGVDVMTGTCLAILTTLKGDSKITCYTFAGNCAVQIPLSGGNYAQMITSLAGFLVGGVGAIATGNPIMALGAGASFMHGSVSVQHSGSIGSNAGACGTRTPYVIITRKVAYDAQNYQHYYGFPSNNHVKLGTCKGYTQVKSCHVESIYRATDNEKREMESLLKEGVIII